MTQDEIIKIAEQEIKAGEIFSASDVLLLRTGFVEGYEYAEQSRWIPVSEGLPTENRQEVLFVVKGVFCSGIFLKKDQFERENMFCDGGYHSIEWVSHWMLRPALPSPPNK